MEELGTQWVIEEEISKLIISLYDEIANSGKKQTSKWLKSVWIFAGIRAGCYIIVSLVFAAAAYHIGCLFFNEQQAYQERSRNCSVEYPQ